MQPDLPENKKRSFWDTTTGFITKVTAFIAAVTALVIAVKSFNANVIPSKTPDPVNNSVQQKSVTTTPSDKPSEPQPQIQTPVETKPDISITAFSVSPTSISLNQDAKPQTIQVTAEANNAGNGLASNCVLTVETDNGVLQNASSPSFSLEPNERKSFTINALISTTGNLRVKLTSDNNDSKESTAENVVVWPFGMMHTPVRGHP